MHQQKSFKVLLIGDSCIDRYVYGSCERLNPEAPVPILKYSRIEEKPGMCLNVKSNLEAFGVDVETITQKETIIKTRYIDEKTNHQILRVDEEYDVKCFNDLPINLKYDALVISDYNKGFLTQEKLFELVELFDGPIFVDSKKTTLPNKCYVKINDLEYKKLINFPENLIITRGNKGAEYKGKLFSTDNVNVFDVVGAGDTFLSSLVYFYLCSNDIEKAIPYANKAASISVQYRGTYTLTKEQIKTLKNHV